MNTAVLFGLATIVIISFILAKLANPETEKPKLENSSNLNSNLGKEWNMGAFLLRLGPALAGFGLLGYLVQEWWDNTGLRLLLVIMMMILSHFSAFIIYKFFTLKSKSNKIFAEGLLLIGTFMIGATLQTANEFAFSRTGARIFGLGEIMGLWFLFSLPIAYLAKSAWLLGVNALVNLTWLSTYLLTPNQEIVFNLSYIFNIQEKDIFISPVLYVFLPVISAVSLILLYAWHQTQRHFEAKHIYRAFYYLTGLMGYLTAGALVYRGVVENFAFFQNSNRGLYADLIVAIFTLGIFLVDFIAKKTYQKYNINYLTPIILIIAAILGPLIFSTRYFIGFYFLEIGYIVWLLADYLRQNSQLAQVLFYGFNAVQLFALSSNPDSFNWFRLICMLSIIMYASVVHYKNRGLVFYTVIAGISALVLKLFATGANGYLFIFALGVILMAFGVYYTQTRTKMLANLPPSDEPNHEIVEQI